MKKYILRYKPKIYKFYDDSTEIVSYHEYISWIYFQKKIYFVIFNTLPRYISFLYEILSLCTFENKTTM